MKNGKTQTGEVAVLPFPTGGSELQEVCLVCRGGFAQLGGVLPIVSRIDALTNPVAWT